MTVIAREGSASHHTAKDGVSCIDAQVARDIRFVCYIAHLGLTGAQGVDSIVRTWRTKSNLTA